MGRLARKSVVVALLSAVVYANRVLLLGAAAKLAVLALGKAASLPGALGTKAGVAHDALMNELAASYAASTTPLDKVPGPKPSAMDGVRSGLDGAGFGSMTRQKPASATQAGISDRDYGAEPTS